MTEFADKVRSLGFPRRSGEAEVRTVREQGALTTTVEHWDGRVDVNVTPDVYRYRAIQHRTGKNRGQVAEVREMTTKERRERHGDR